MLYSINSFKYDCRQILYNESEDDIKCMYKRRLDDIV